MHREAIPDSVWGLLLGLSRLRSIQSCYLAGGTALAIQLGHRVSGDLDFFLREGLDYDKVLADLPALGMGVTVMSRTPAHCELMLNSVKVDFIRERIRLQHPLKSLVVGPAIISMAHALDIGRLKLFTIASRGSRKDFIDLYCLTREVIALEDLVSLAMERQQNLRFNSLLFLKGLIDFEEADQDVQPDLLWNISWDRVKEDLVREVRQLAEKLANLNPPS